MDLNALLNLLATVAGWVIQHWQPLAIALVALLVLSIFRRRDGPG